jgi:hypothetical protein
MSKHKPVLKTNASAYRTKPVREPDLPLLLERQPANGHSSPDEPSLEKKVPVWDVRVPVFQWDIDPTDTERPCGSAEIKYRGWDFRMWWEKHRVGLVYASIQATRGSRESDWQGGWTSPPHSTLTVSLVYDEQRQGVVTVQGNARDLRPFIDAFLMAFGAGPSF